MKTPNSSARIERSLRQRLLSAYRRDLAFRPERIIVGFSGGPDSLALAALLAGVQRAIPSPILLLHVDHQIRSGSGGEARRCGELAEALGLPFTSIRIPDHPRLLHPGVGLEEAARRARYQAFAAIAGERDIVALAHHAGDQAETVLLHLMHGAGIGGIAGMRPVSRIPVPWWGPREDQTASLNLWRPLLAEHRDDLLTVIEQRGLTPLHDESNDDPSLKRNAIRHLALPVLRQIEPTIDDRLVALSRIAADEDALLDGQAGQLIATARLTCGGLWIQELNEAPVALARRTVRHWLDEELGITPTFERVEAVLELARTGDHSAQVDVGDGMLAGCFAEAIRAGTLEGLRHQAWEDAGLQLPLVSSDAAVRIAGDTITVAAAFHHRERDAARALPAPGRISIERVRSSTDMDGWKEWFRQERISPWIRDLVQGVAIDGVVWWIPRQGDYDDAGGRRCVRVVWSGRERD